MDEWHFIAERKIREAMEEGVFEHLDGVGEPLDLSENPFEDPAQRMAHRILRNNGFAPAWIEEGRDIDAEIRYLKANYHRLNDGERARRVDVLNRRIAAYNLKTPVASAQKLTFHP
jgi:DnaJ family protein C protein 28